MKKPQESFRHFKAGRTVMKASMAIILLLLGVFQAFAGEVIDFECVNPKCRFHAECQSGGGFNFEQLSGYCFGCKKFVSIAWDRKKSPPAGLKTVWVPQDFRSKGAKNLFPCPSCGNYVYSFSIDPNSKAKLYCPKCGQGTLHAKVPMNYD